MRILLICPFFPPENKISAVRIAKFAQHWSAAGHDVRVLTRVGGDEGLTVPTHDNLTVVRVTDPLARPVSAVQSHKPTKLGFVYKVLAFGYGKALGLIWPDYHGPWARRAAREVARWDWRPDVVVASVGPFSTLRLGSQLAERFKTKFVVDYRDLLSLSTYYPHGRIRKWIDGRVERSIAAKADLLATVSAPLAKDLAEAYGRPTVVVTNGYDPADFESLEYSPGSKTLRIAHCGSVIWRRRDPRPFLRGVARLVEQHPDVSVSVDFYGPPSVDVTAAVEELNLSGSVNQHGKTSHQESLRIQAAADVLLLLLWDNPGEAGVLSGKVFEYLGARRPILMTGYTGGAAADLIRETGAGLVTNDPDAIATYLADRADEKVRTGRVEEPELSKVEQYTRDAQSGLFLQQIEGL